jgi:hypothetical protein
VARLYAETLVVFFVASYDSQAYGGGIRLRLVEDLLSPSSGSTKKIMKFS